ncbi:hypothetical protein Cgig2_015577 [Carnegiea gigantea]|uniref:Uncharacterized protein n=1 Tax=Carnegiea gigantea TaxID=171969 RepID=A0A9Q1GIR1_9CARY|nr:hypothetical protein Cgig2_015577 [Carnegiea gigantea]
MGIPIKTDKYTRDRTMLKYARLLIEVNLEGPFPEFVDFINENGVKFEWLPAKCNHCLMYGHEETFYRKKERVRKEWRPIPKEEIAALATTPLPLASQPRNPEVEFTPVTRRVVAIHTLIATWRPSAYTINILSQTEQMIHYQATQLSTNRGFCITFVHEMNQEMQRQSLWTDLYEITQ